MLASIILMTRLLRTLSLLAGILAVVPAYATVTIQLFTPTPVPPQQIGTTITFVATATDTSPGPVAFQYNVTPPNGSLTMIRDFNMGTLSGGTWTGPAFAWDPTGIEGTYQVEVVAKDFVTGQIASRTIHYAVEPLVTGKTPLVKSTANPLVALFSAPSCAAGSTMRVAFEVQAGGAASTTDWVGCHPPATMTFEVAGMYASTVYNMHAETKTNGKITNGPAIVYTTGALPTSVPFPTFSGNAGTDTTNPVLLHTFITFGTGAVYPDVATDLNGKTIWYYYSNGVSHIDTMTRPLVGGERSRYKTMWRGIRR